VQDLPQSLAIPSLVDSKIWKIRVVAPRLQNMKVVTDAGNKTMTISWSSYVCQNTGAQIVIYRKEGCSTYTPDKCITGLPKTLGYVEIARVPVSTTSYVDKNLKPNVDYSYRTVVLFTNGVNTTESVVSDQVCDKFKTQMSVLTNVTVDKTDKTTGEVTVKWIHPISLDKTTFKGPYQYRLYRATGLNGTTFQQVSPNIDTDLSGTKADTIFTDKGLNTTDNAYNYRLSLYYTSNTGLTLLDSTQTASSVRLAATADKKVIGLSWQAIVPWKNDNQIHRIYRETRSGSGVFNRIADVPVTSASSFSFTDKGTDTYTADGVFTATMSPDSSYCYKVETVGTYGDANIKPALLYNLSQIICATPLSDIVPCPPQLTLALLNCEQYKKDNSNNCDMINFENKLTWTNPEKTGTGGSDCTKKIVKYNVYYTDKVNGTFAKIAEVNTPQPPALAFNHIKTDSYLGCYYVTATDNYGVESAPSNTVCQDNCPNFELPNVFTPNGDGKNDVFQALKCPRFVQNLTFVVYNRSGQKVYEYAGSKLEWNGSTTSGQELPVGSYFYTCEVKFLTLDPNTPTLTLKGWIELLR
jgi:gliding motility-associated-like protein